MKVLSLLMGLILSTNLLFAQDLYKVTADKLNVRESADAKSKIIGFVPNGENVQVLESSDPKFYKIKVTNGEGWASKEFLTKIESAKPATPKAVVKESTAVKTTDYNNIIVLMLVGGLLVIGLIIALKYTNNKAIVGLAILIVVAISYFTYANFFEQKNVSGRYINTKVKAQYESFDFISKDSVMVRDFYTDSTFTTPYTITDNIIRLKDNENVIILLVQDENVLIGEGFTDGTFKR